jgi:hypothetical protein
MNKNKNKNKDKINVRSARMSNMSTNSLNGLGSSIFILKQVSSNVIAKGLKIYFKNGDNQREQTVDVDLPQNLQFAKVTLEFALRCPSNNCDAWDRLGTFGIFDEERRYLELFRFITPYGIGAQWTADLSDFLPLLEGKKTFRIFIDTWVGPGHPQGNGWLVDASLQFERGESSTRALYVHPLLRMEDIIYGDPKQSTKREVEVTLKNTPRSSSARLYTIITGHGQGNADNCAEFCPKNHTISFAGRTFSKTIWRNNCKTSVDPKQKGNYQYSRAGWCPGDKVYPWIIDIKTDDLLSDFEEFKYDVDPYLNTCRPDAVQCSGCAFRTLCSYDGGLHTEPRYYVSSYLISYLI